MGEAYTAQSDDISSLYWNPAGVALLNQSEATFMYNQYVQGLNYNHAAVGVPLENGGVGASVSYLGYGTISAYDSAGNPAGDVNAYSGVGTLGGAWLGDTWSAGANVKGIQSSLADTKADGFAADLGGNFIYPHEVLGGSTLRLAAAVRNLGSGMKFLSQNDPFPMQWRLGAALVQMWDRKLNFSLDYGKMQSENGAVYAGVEYWLIPYLALRTGYAGSSAEGSGLRAGIGLRFKDLSFDYAYANYGDLGMTSLYELSYRFGSIRPVLSPEERRMLRQARIAMRNGEYGKAILLLDSLVKLEPQYKLFQRLERTAMAGLEQQENLAKSAGQYRVLTVPKQAQGSLSDLDDLEQLLRESDSAEKGASLNKPPAAASRER
jgi:hypothetical protein